MGGIKEVKDWGVPAPRKRMCLIVPSLWLSIVPVEGNSHSESLVGAFCRTSVGPSLHTEARCRLTLLAPGQPACSLLDYIDNVNIYSSITSLPSYHLPSADG